LFGALLGLSLKSRELRPRPVLVEPPYYRY